MRPKNSHIFGLMLIMLLIIGCRGESADQTPAVPLDTPVPTVTPQPANGQISGTVTFEKSGEGLQSALIILCLLTNESEPEDYICILQPEPTALSGSDGAFSLTEVPPGSYVLLFGRSNEIISSPQEWAGVKVNRGEHCMSSYLGTENVCESTEFAFWEKGGAYGPGTFIIMTGEDGFVEFFGMSQGVIRSVSLGISIMIQDRVLAPVVEVLPGETTEIDWQIVGEE